MVTKKSSKKIKWLIRIFFIVLALVTIFFVIFNPLTFMAFHQISSSIVGCDGLGKYYTNNGFEEDYSLLKKDYDKCGSSVNGTLFSSGIHIYPRRAENICDGKHFDCNDFSHAVVCLGEKYNLECKPVFYLMTGNGGLFGLYGTHFVTRCENDKVYD